MSAGAGIEPGTMTIQGGGSRCPGKEDGHVLMFPFMAKSHTIPLLHLSAALSRRGLRVTVITTPASSPFLSRYLRLPDPNIRFLHLPFPSVPQLPPGCESTDNLPSFDLYFTFHHATSLLAQPFRDALRGMADAGDLPLCVISDFFLGWTRLISEDEFGVPRLVFTGMGAFAEAVVFAIIPHRQEPDRGLSLLPDRQPRLALRDLPSALQDQDPGNAFVEITKLATREARRSFGSVSNSFAAMEHPEYVDLMGSYFESEESRAWLVGPLSVFPCGEDAATSALLGWLDGKPVGSVLYVAFGMQAVIAGEQLDEIAHGLALSGCSFAWVVRSGAWVPPVEVDEEKGVVWREMAPQRAVLEHPATGGFLSHCGWNSVVESVAAGVPILAWPMLAISEQGLNARYVVDGVGVGLRLAASGGPEVVGREEICRGVRELMEGEGGRRAREQAEELGEAARAAVQEGGSSFATLEELLRHLRRKKQS